MGKVIRHRTFYALYPIICFLGATTFRAGLLATDQLMASLSLAERIDQHFPQPKSNRGFKPSEILKTFILMQHEGSFHLDDVRHLQDDDALRTVLGLKKLPSATTLGSWLRRMGRQPQIQACWVKVTQPLCTESA